jgi:hypothetical protein
MLKRLIMIDINMKVVLLMIYSMDKEYTLQDHLNINMKANLYKVLLKVIISSLILIDYPNEFRIYVTSSIKN